MLFGVFSCTFTAEIMVNNAKVLKHEQNIGRRKLHKSKIWCL